MAAAGDGPQLADLQKGDRVRVQGGKNFEKFHGGMEGTIVENNPEGRNLVVHFDEHAENGQDPMTVAYRHLEHAPNRGGYRAGKQRASESAPGGAPASVAPKAPVGPLLEAHNGFKTRQLVQLQGLQSAPELNGKYGRLRKFDENAGRWEVDVRGGGGIKRLKEDNLLVPPKPEVPTGLTVEELKARGNEFFKQLETEQAVAYYSACIDLLEDGDPKPTEAADPKYVSVMYGNRSQCYINLCREVHGEERVISKECRLLAMRANMDSARAIELDGTNGKAYYRRGCAVLGMAPSASRAKEAIEFLEIALTGRASGGKDGVVLPNAMRQEVTNLLEYARRRLDACTEAATIPDPEQCRQQ